MLLGVEKDHFKLAGVFHVLGFIFETLSISQAEKFWQAMESRRYALANDLSRAKSPGIMLIRHLNSLVQRLDPHLDTEFRAKVELFYLEAFGPNNYDLCQRPEKVPLLITSEEGSNDDFELLLSVEKSLANKTSITESSESLEAFLDKIDRLEACLSRVKRLVRGKYREHIISPELVEFQVRDRSFQFKIGMQVLLFIEALLLLRPSETKIYNAQKATKSLVWSSLALDDNLCAKVRQAKKGWFNLLKAQATNEQLETVRLVITREKETVASLLKDPVNVEKGEKVDLQAELNVKTRPKHFYDMGNQELTSLHVGQDLGPEAFIASKDKEQVPAELYYQRSKRDEDEAIEGDRWVALFTKRGTNWGAFNIGEPPSIGPVFGEPESPRSPSSRESTPVPAASKDDVPDVEMEGTNTSVHEPPAFEDAKAVPDQVLSNDLQESGTPSLDSPHREKENGSEEETANMEPSPKRPKTSHNPSDSPSWQA